MGHITVGRSKKEVENHCLLDSDVTMCSVGHVGRKVGSCLLGGGGEGHKVGQIFWNRLCAGRLKTPFSPLGKKKVKKKKDSLSPFFFKLGEKKVRTFDASLQFQFFFFLSISFPSRAGSNCH